jgi:hypothetical protein
MSEPIQGKRVDKEPHQLESGEYCFWHNGWWGRVPDDRADMIANLANHKIIDNADGTISVTPSILVSSWKGISWHGYLTNGQWVVC